MKNLWRWGLALLIVAGVVAGIFWLRAQRTQNTGQEILRTAEINRGDLEITVSASGNIAANRRAELRFETAGTVAEILVEVGDDVTPGTPLARLETQELERAVRQSEYSLRQAELRLERLERPPTEEELRRAQHAVSQTANALEIARLNRESVLDSSLLNEDLQAARDRFSDLETQYGVRQTEFEEGKVSDWTLDRAREAADNAYWQLVRLEQQAELEQERAENEVTRAWQNYREAVDNLERLQADPDDLDLESSRLDVETAQLALERAQENRDAAILTAPFDGVVATVNAQEGLPAPTTAPAVTLVDETAFFINVTVDETDIGKLEVGQQVTVLVDAYPGESLEGVVETIAPAPGSSADNVGIVSYPVRIRLNGSEVVVRDGMTASVSILTSRLENVLLAPNWAIRTDQNSRGTYTYCFCLDNGSVERREVTIGRRNEQYTEILSGLEEGVTLALVTEERSLFDLAGGGPPNR